MKCRSLVAIAVLVWGLSLNGLAVEQEVAQREVCLIKDGVPQLADKNDGSWIDEDWHSHDGALAGKGVGNVLTLPLDFGAGDYRLLAEMTIDDLRHSAASISINDSQFGFEGGRGEMFTEGNLLGDRSLGMPMVSSGKAFEIELERKEDLFYIRIDDKQVLAVPLNQATSVVIGFRPWRSKMRLHQLTMTGMLQSRSQLGELITVYREGAEGYPKYRIPAMVKTQAGTLLAFCEGRTGGDSGPIDVVLKRSLDQGRTWGPLQVVWDDAENTCGNPCPVVDESTGVIWLLMTWNKGTDDEGEIMAGKSEDVRHVFITKSEDDGLTWEKPKCISSTTRMPHWRWYATGPGNAIQLKQGKYQGRLLIPCNHSDHSTQQHPYRSHVIYSDDHGKTWQLGGIHQEKTNESAVVELSDGRVMQAMRSYHGQGLRAMAISEDGGESWGKVYLDQALQTPVCQASIIRFPRTKDQQKTETTNRSVEEILFASPKGGSRSHMTVWVSRDDGKTWPTQREVYSGSAGYSNLVALSNSEIGLLFERDDYRKITFTSFNFKLLENQ